MRSKVRKNIRINWLESPMMFGILKTIAINDKMSFSELQELYELEPSTITDNLGILKAEGIIIVKPDSKDGRKKHYIIDWSGLLESYLDYFKDFAEGNDKRINKEQKTQAQEMLKKFLTSSRAFNFKKMDIAFAVLSFIQTV